MGTQEPQPGRPDNRRFLTAAVYFLNHRDFASCRTYALRARDSDPTHLSPTQILSIASVLSAPNISPTRPDYYSILNLPQFDPDAARIASTFKTLASVLNPKSNPYPLSSEAFDLVMEAWSVLSDPAEKALFDAELRRRDGGGGGGTFWTICPYCYYVYEYDSVYEDCCLRCANERCGRVLHAAAIAAPPPPDVVERGRYLCPGFMPLEIRGSRGENLWVPFGKASKGFDHDCFVVDEEDAGAENGELITGEFERDSNGEVKGGNESLVMENEVGKKRRKSVAWNSRKVMGRGIRVDGLMNEGYYRNVDQNGGETRNDVGIGGVEFYEGDDDVFVACKWFDPMSV